MPAYQSRRPAGFTIIEILVVVSIIMLLIAILLPMLTKSRDAGQLAICTSNLKQLGQAMQSYQAQNKMRFTRGELYGATGDNVAEFLWAGKKGTGALAAIDADVRYLNAFIGGPYSVGAEVDLAQCPKDLRLYENNSGSSYGSNHRRGVNSLVLADGVTPINAAQVDKPEQFVIGGEYGAILSAYNDSSYVNNYQIKWHWPSQNRFNTLFADIHVESLSMLWGTMMVLNDYNFEYK